MKLESLKDDHWSCRFDYTILFRAKLEAKIKKMTEKKFKFGLCEDGSGEYDFIILQW